MMPRTNRPSATSCLLHPIRIARHNVNGYTADSRQTRPEHTTCAPPLLLLQSPPRPLQRFVNDSRTHHEFDIHLVGFFTGSPVLLSSCPYWQRSHVTASTSG